jgi:uncharacterized membrane protein YjjB (DUF3815 family)
MSTLLACLAIGLMANVAADRLRLPFSAVAFTGAAPMMPGVYIYQSIAGAMRLSAAGTSADPALAAATLALTYKSVFVVGAMVIGLLVGARLSNLASPGLNQVLQSLDDLRRYWYGLQGPAASEHATETSAQQP